MTLMNITELGNPDSKFSIEDKVNFLLSGNIGLPKPTENDDGEIIYEVDDDGNVVLTPEPDFTNLMVSDIVYARRQTKKGAPAGAGKAYMDIDMYASSYINILYIKASQEQKSRIYSKYFLRPIRNTVTSIVAELSKEGGNLNAAGVDPQTAINIDSKKELISAYYTRDVNQEKIIKALGGRGLTITFQNEADPDNPTRTRAPVAHSRLSFVYWVAEKKESTLGPFVGLPALKAQLKLSAELIELQGNKANFGVGSLTIDNFFEATGFEDFVKEQDGWLEAEIGSFSELIDKEKQVNQAVVNRGVASARVGENVKKDLTDEQTLARNQCALMTDLLHKGWTYNDYPKTWITIFTNEDGSIVTQLDPFYGRIYPIAIDDGQGGYSQENDPDIIMNAFNVSGEDVEYFKQEDLGSNEMYWDIYWVYLDGLGGVNENKIFKSGNDYENFINDPDGTAETRFMINDFYEEGELTSEAQNEFENNIVNYVMSQIEVKFEGTNPATARRDLQATLTINLPNLRGIDSICSVLKYAALNEDNTREDVIKYLKIYEMVTAPTVQSPETERLPNASLKNSYSPDFFRLRLKMWAGGNKENAIIVDLTTVDHSITRNDDVLGSSVLTINYRGYFQGLLENPINSATASREVVKLSKEGDLKMKKLLEEKGCTEDVVAKFALANKTLIEGKAIEDLRKGKIFTDLFTNGKFFRYKINQDLVDINTYEEGVDPRNKYTTGDFTQIGGRAALSAIESLQQQQNIAGLGNLISDVDIKLYTQIRQGAATTANQLGVETEAQLGTRGINDILLGRVGYCVMLGDFLNAIIDNLFKDYSSEPEDHNKQAPLKFIMSPIRIPNPNYYSLTLDGASTEKEFLINPVQIPLNVGFLSSWFEENYVKPERTNVSIGELLADLVNKLINELIYKNCFKILDTNLSDSPPQFSSTQLVSEADDWFEYRSDGWLDLSEVVGSAENAALMQTDAGNSKIENAKNYFIFYQAIPQKSTTQLPMKEKVPTLYYGSNFSDLNYCSDVSFTKTDIEYLREARYFNSGMGNLSLLSNVYDLSFSFDSQKASTIFYPGNVINFILTDWAGPNKYLPGRALGESDPHVKGRIANILGFGGHYIITRVTYTIKSTSASDFVIKIDTKFKGTDAERLSVEAVESKKAKSVVIPDACLDIVNDMISKANTQTKIIDGDGTIAYQFNDNTKTEEKPAEENASNPNDGSTSNEERVPDLQNNGTPLVIDGTPASPVTVNPNTSNESSNDDPFAGTVFDSNDPFAGTVFAGASRPATVEEINAIGVPSIIDIANNINQTAQQQNTTFVDAQNPSSEGAEGQGDKSPDTISDEEAAEILGTNTSTTDTSETTEIITPDADTGVTPISNTNQAPSPPRPSVPDDGYKKELGSSSSVLGATGIGDDDLYYELGGSDPYFLASEALAASNPTLEKLRESKQALDEGNYEKALRTYSGDSLSDEQIGTLVNSIEANKYIGGSEQRTSGLNINNEVNETIENAKKEYVKSILKATTKEERERLSDNYVQTVYQEEISYINEQLKEADKKEYSPSRSNITIQDLAKAEAQLQRRSDEELIQEIDNQILTIDKAIDEAEAVRQQANDSTKKEIDNKILELYGAKNDLTNAKSPDYNFDEQKIIEKAAKTVSDLETKTQEVINTTNQNTSNTYGGQTPPPTSSNLQEVVNSLRSTGGNNLYAYLLAARRVPMDVKLTIPPNVEIPAGYDFEKFMLINSDDTGKLREFQIFYKDGSSIIIEVKG
jgi:hypothetical protein